jgi:hypothetical protein
MNTSPPCRHRILLTYKAEEVTTDSIVQTMPGQGEGAVNFGG